MRRARSLDFTRDSTPQMRRKHGCWAAGASQGFTLIEMMLGASIMIIVMVALMGGVFGQSFLNMNARNLLAAMNDATRVMEQIRQQNTGNCQGGIPSAAPAGAGSWNVWLGANGGKSITQADMFEHLAVTCQDGRAIACTTGAAVTCPNGTDTVVCPAVGATVLCPGDGTPVTPIPAYCGRVPNAGLGVPAQTGAGEWQSANAVTQFDPIRVTVAVGWRQGGRTLGSGGAGQEFVFSGGGLVTTGSKTTVAGVGNLVTNDSDGDGVIESQAMLTTLVTCR